MKLLYIKYLKRHKECPLSEAHLKHKYTQWASLPPRRLHFPCSDQLAFMLSPPEALNITPVFYTLLTLKKVNSHPDTNKILCSKTTKPIPKSQASWKNPTHSEQQKTKSLVLRYRGIWGTEVSVCKHRLMRSYWKPNAPRNAGWWQSQQDRRGTGNTSSTGYSLVHLAGFPHLPFPSRQSMKLTASAPSFHLQNL